MVSVSRALSACKVTELTEQTRQAVTVKDGVRGGVSYTLNTIDRPAVVCLNDQGGGNDECNRKFDSNYQKPDGRSSTVGALQARDYKGVGNQYVEEGKVIVCYSRPSDS